MSAGTEYMVLPRGIEPPTPSLPIRSAVTQSIC